MATRDTQRKGDLAVAMAIADFTEAGWDVSVPLTESAAYDLIVDTPEGLKRVQSKFCGVTPPLVDLRNVHSNSKGYVVKRSAKDAYDWLYVYRPGYGSYLLKRFVTRSTITVNASHGFKLWSSTG